MSEKDNIHSGHRERMIKRFVADDKNLLEHELLEIMLFSMLPRVNTNPIAHKLIKAFGGIKGVFNASIVELTAIAGVGEKTARKIRLLGAIFEKVKLDDKSKPAFTSFEVVKKQIDGIFKNENNEKFCLFLLDRNYKQITALEFYNEEAQSVTAEIPDIAKAFAVYKPKNVIIAHNHPSGLADASEKDDLATKKINLLCMAHGVNLADHIIYGKERVYSYMQSGQIDKIKKQADLNELLNNL